MPVSELKLIKRCAELIEQENITRVPENIRGIYTLLKYNRKRDKYNVVYVGMAGGETKAGVAARLRTHKRKKGHLWTHFSIFEVWDNIREEEIRELEGIFRHIYCKDTRANRLNKQRAFKKLSKIQDNNLKNWKK